MKQEYLVIYKYNETQSDFYRHTQKELRQVIRLEKKFLNSDNAWISKDDEQTKIIIYKTDYEAREDNKVLEKTIKEFMEA